MNIEYISESLGNLGKVAEVSDQVKFREDISVESYLIDGPLESQDKPKGKVMRWLMSFVESALPRW